jgi:hypothetical protein
MQRQGCSQVKERRPPDIKTNKQHQDSHVHASLNLVVRPNICLPLPLFSSCWCVCSRTIGASSVEGAMSSASSLQLPSLLSVFIKAAATAALLVPTTTRLPGSVVRSCHIFCFFAGLSESDPMSVTCIFYRMPGALCFHNPSAHALGISSVDTCPFQSRQGRNVQ